MPSRYSEDLFVGIVGLVFDTVVYAFIVSAINLHPLFVVPLVILALMTVLTLVVWRQEKVRIRLLILSQRFIVYLLIPPLAGLALGLLIVSLAVRVNPHIPLIDGVPVIWITVGAGATAFLVVTLLLELACRHFNTFDITASRCYYVVRKLDRLSVEGKYYFERNSTRHAVRRESRILDHLSKRPDACVRRRFLLGYTITPGKDILQNLSTNSLLREKSLADRANDLWRDGSRRRWRSFGTPVQPLQFHKIFGNQLDDLFNNAQGFRVYDTGGPRFVTMVIKGPPGAGKSTLALQMCVSLACQGNFCMYYSLEEEREGLLKSAQNFRWDNPDAPPYDKNGDSILAGAAAAQASGPTNYGGVRHASFHESRAQLKGRQAFLKKQAFGEEIKASLKAMLQNVGGMVLVSSLGGRAMSFRMRMRRLGKVWGGRLGNVGDLPEVARCVVIDSLEGFANVGLEQEGQIAVPRGELISLKDFFRDRCQMLVIVVEDDGANKPGFVDFVADVVIQLGRREDAKSEYTILTAEILKARNQKHALGQHQIKIISREDLETRTGSAAQDVYDLAPGIQVFPSLHYHLSLSARRETFDKHFLSIGLAGLDEMFNADPTFDETRTRHGLAGPEPLIRGDQLRLRRPSATALIGPGGTAKSLIAMNFLIEGIRENTKTLLLSFRDDEGTVINRALAQGSGRIRFAFAGKENHGSLKLLDRKENISSYYHRFEWTIDEIAHWVRSDQRRARLPYLFQQGPASYETFQASSVLQAEAEAVMAFLRQLAQTCPPDYQWTPAARMALRDAYADAWQTFLDEMRGKLILVGPDTPKTLELVDGAEQGKVPRIVWDSRYLDPVTNTRKANTELLQIMALRPGNITPEDFVARILRVIGKTDENRQYERVVFDDVSQLQHGFPLLANSQLLLRTLIDIFKAKGMTSLFIADTANGAEDDLDRGLADMTDHVVRTQVRYRSLTADKSLASKGTYANRVIVVELEGRPGVAQQAPHLLWVTESDIIKLERLP